MKKLFWIPLLILAACSLARAQVQPVQATLNSVSTGQCIPTSCLTYTVPSGVGGATFSVTGSSGTITFEVVDINGNYSPLNVTQSNSSSPASTATVSGNSQFQANVAGYYQIRARLTSAGSAAVVITPSTASARSGGVSGGSLGSCGLTDALAYYSSGQAITCDQGITTNASGQLSATGGFVAPGDGVHAGQSFLYGNTANPALPGATGYAGFWGGNNTSFTSWGKNFSVLGPGLETDALGTTPTNDWILYNATAAGAGAQQYSSANGWCGYGWKTTSVAASQIVCGRMYIVPIQGTTAPIGSLTFQTCIGGSCPASGWATQAQFRSNGENFFGLDVQSPQFLDDGSTFTASGCSNGTLVGGSTHGSYKSGTNGTCTVTITFGNGAYTNNGWACSAWDVTTPADVQKQTGMANSTVTISGTTVSGDVITFGCEGY